MKRLFDTGLALFGLFLAFPVILVITLLIKLDDGGPLLFRQVRLGRFKKPFMILKFRTMRDGKVTRAGRWLRATGLDELPQLINVLRGEMSIVGPRPLTLQDVQRLGWDSRYYIARWQVLPGLTGPGQLHAGVSAHHSWFYDRYYVRHQSFHLDCQVIVISAIMNVIGKHSVRQWLRVREARKPNWQRWVLLFGSRRERALPEIKPDYAKYSWSEKLARSLAIFQLGESGGGTIVGQVRHSHIRAVDAAYSQAVEWFVDEEHRHADILARCVQALDGKLIKKNWTASLFVFARRLMGLRLKILVLLAAEIVGICYYKLLATRLPLSPLRSALEEIATDEAAHLKFHSDFLRSQTGGWLKGIIFRFAWRSVMFAAVMVVLFDHYRALRALNIPLRLAWQRWFYLVRQTEQQVLNQRPDYRFLHQVNVDYA